MVRQDSPQRPEDPCRLSRSAEGLHFTGTHLRYRITGLTAHNLDRLQVTLQAALPDSPSSFHIDKLDLYSGRARESFADSCAKYLKVQPPEVMAELSQIIKALEAERISMRSGGDKAQLPPMSEEAKAEALKALKSKDLFKIILAGFDSMGYIGEKYNKLIGFLATVSRLLPDPLAILFLSRPGAGKTGLQNAVCKMVPPESVIQYTRVTGQALFYREADAFKNKVLSIEEEGGMREAHYSVRTLVTSQNLSTSTTRTDAKTGKFAADDYVVKGPVVVMVSTTDPQCLDDETRGRFITLSIDESPEQTKRILQAQFTKNTLDWYKTTAGETAVLTLHHNMQRLIKPLTVTFSRDLKLAWPFSRLQMRREQGKFLALAKSITLLFQHQRKTGTVTRLDGTKIEYVTATQQDIDLALELGREAFTRNIDDLSPPSRRLLTELIKLVSRKRDDKKALNPKEELLLSEIPFTRKELRDEIGWSDTQVKRHLDYLVELGYLGKIAGRQGAVYRYVLLDDGSSDPVVDLGEMETPPDALQDGKSTT